jgi:hypothetical protein
MPNTILNDPSASNNAASFAPQSRPDKGDIDVWTAGHNGIGVVSGGVVTVTGTTAVSVAASTAVVAPTGTPQIDKWSAASNLALAAADTTNDRVDLVVGTDGVGMQVLTGTPGNPCVWPSFNPNTQVVLAQVTMPHGASSITSTNVIDKRVIVPAPFYARQTATITSPSLQNAAFWQGSIPLAKSYRLINITTSIGARVRLYDRAAKQTADASRKIAAKISGDIGLTYEWVGSGSLLAGTVNPAVLACSMETTPSASIPITVDNLSGSTGAITVTLTFFALE